MAKAKKPVLVYELKITLKNTNPPVWRRLQVKDCSLAMLHSVIQFAMGWSNYHMHEFTIGGEHYAVPSSLEDLDAEDSRKVKLSQLVDSGVKNFTYTYDFGDNWDHFITLEKTLVAEPGVHYPRCVAGKMACPPEDCGGPWGYVDFLKTIQNKNHPEHEEMLEWCGGEFDPNAFDLEDVNERLKTFV